MTPSAGSRRRRRAAAHACPGCKRPWAVRGVRTSAGPWLFSCRYCGWCDLRGAATPSDAPGPAAPHAVHLYRSDAALAAVIADHLSEGWAAGGSAVVVATPAHRSALREELAARRLTAALQNGRLVQLDAEATLRLFMRDGLPDPSLFDQTVGALLREHAVVGPLHAFGEMVDLLWEGGSPVAALELEQLWSRLQERLAFSLLCAYGAAHLDETGPRVVCSVHGHRVA